MPFDKLFRKESEAEAMAEEVYADELRQEIVKLRRDLEVYETPAWTRVDEVLAEKLERAFRDMMVGDPDQMILARERARVVSDLRALPTRQRELIAEREKDLLQLEGE